MLAAATDGSGLRYPLLASPKLDGVRAIVRDGTVLTRSLKAVPNRHAKWLFGQRGSLNVFEGLDGELIVGPPSAANVYQKTVSGVMSADGEPDVKFYVFDLTGCRWAEVPFAARYTEVKVRARHISSLRLSKLVVVTHKLIRSEDELMRYEASQLLLGFEGVMLRDPTAPYKSGRSTLREQGMLKLKRFSDGEAEILGCVEQQHNANEAKTNALGRTERSSHKAGMIGKNVLGAFRVRDLKTGVEFEVGTGFTDEQRAEFWRQYRHASLGAQSIIGQVIKYKFQAVGVKDKPRFPVFIGFRHKDDM